MQINPEKSVKIFSILLAGSLVFSMETGCANTNENANETTDVQIEQVENNEEENTLDYKCEELDSIIDSAQNSNQSANLTDDEKDAVVTEIFNQIKSSTIEVINETKEDSYELSDKAKNSLKKAVVYSYKFTHNEIPANGIYFKDLTDSGKNIIYSVTDEIKLTIYAFCPDLPNWLSDKKEEITNWLGEENIDSLNEIKDGAKTFGKNMYNRFDDYWEEKSNKYSR